MYRRIFASLAGLLAFIIGNIYLFGLSELDVQANIWGIFAIMSGVLLTSLTTIAVQTWWVQRVSTAALVVALVSQIAPLLYWAQPYIENSSTLTTDEIMYTSLHLGVILLATSALLFKQK